LGQERRIALVAQVRRSQAESSAFLRIGEELFGKTVGIWLALGALAS